MTAPDHDRIEESLYELAAVAYVLDSFDREVGPLAALPPHAAEAAKFIKMHDALMAARKGRT